VSWQRQRRKVVAELGGASKCCEPLTATTGCPSCRTLLVCLAGCTAPVQISIKQDRTMTQVAGEKAGKESPFIFLSATLSHFNKSS